MTPSVPTRLSSDLDIRARGPHALERVLAKALNDQSWLAKGRGKPFYAVGGSWRAWAQVHMDLSDHPLPMVHHYVLPKLALPTLVRSLAQMGVKRLKQVPNLSPSRIQTLPGAAALLSATVNRIGARDRKSVVQGKSVSVRVEHGGGGIIKTKNT